MSEIFKQPATLIYVVKDGKVLLARKTRKVNVGKWTGYGGKMDGDETELECAKRELEGESGLVVQDSDLEKVGVIDFYNNETDNIWRVHTYIARNFVGDVKETEEMDAPMWVDISNLDFNMMPWSDVYWLPLILQYNKKINVEVHQNPFYLKIEDMK